MKQKKQHPAKKHVLRFSFSLVLITTLTIIFLLLHHGSQPALISQQLALPEVEVEYNVPAPIIEPEEELSAWKTITTRKKDTLGGIFKREGLSQKTLQAILHDNPHAKTITDIRPNQPIQILVQDDILKKIIFQHSPTQLLVVALEGDHYVTTVKSRTMETHDEYVTATAKGSLYGTATRNGIPIKLIRKMAEVFHWELDFSKDVKEGDRFSILYQAQYIDDKLVNTGDILAVTYTSRDMQHQAIRYPSPDGGNDYFTPDGKSLRKAFSRYPVRFSHISSTFSLSRRHPILHTYRPHKGVYLAARMGTPIRATGDGRIIQIGRQNAYGNMIKIQHSRMYTSVYGHMLRFQKGISRGSYVKQGQIIGYVGQSGLATGPHCHYEFQVYHQPKNPSTIPLPHASPIASKQRLDFQNKAHHLLASLKLYESGYMVASDTHQPSHTG